MTAATSKIERFVIIVDSFQPLTIITKRSLLDVAAALDPPLPSVDVEYIFNSMSTFPKQVVTSTAEDEYFTIESITRT